jgi:putative transposase
MQKWRNWEAATELDWLLALRRESVIAPLAAQSKVGLRRVNEAALQLGLRRSVIYDLLKRYRRRSQTSSLLPGKRGREPEVPVLKEVRERLLSSWGHLTKRNATYAKAKSDQISVRNQRI